MVPAETIKVLYRIRRDKHGFYSESYTVYNGRGEKILCSLHMVMFGKFGQVPAETEIIIVMHELVLL